jgi:hypothetical protein
LLLIARAMNGIGPDGMWDEEDSFYYDVLRLPDGNATRLKVRSMAGLLPLCAAMVVEKWQRERVPRLTAALHERLQRMPELRESIHETGPGQLGVAERGMMGLVNKNRLRRILTRMLDLGLTSSASDPIRPFAAFRETDNPARDSTVEMPHGWESHSFYHLRDCDAGSRIAHATRGNSQCDALRFSRSASVC